eukprot:5714218-Pyramimonas_sp.AAC.1
MDRTSHLTRQRSGSENGTPRSPREEQPGCPQRREALELNAHPWLPTTGREGKSTRKPTPS